MQDDTPPAARPQPRRSGPTGTGGFDGGAFDDGGSGDGAAGRDVTDADQTELDERAALHLAAQGRAGEAAPQGGRGLRVLGHLRRELWRENWLPWQARIRIWEYALGGVLAAALAFGVVRSGLLSSGQSEIYAAQVSAAQLQAGFALSADNVLRYRITLPGAQAAARAVLVTSQGAPLGQVVADGRTHALRLGPAEADLLRAGAAFDVQTAQGSTAGAGLSLRSQ